ncbi:MAG: hypothetical protein HC906_04375 [Bacteroidales bacterium]|nr:hypothetical protein [Bacteroidales bacterium]
MLFFLFLYLTYNNFKSAYFNMNNVDYLLSLRRLIRDIIKFLPLALLIINHRNPLFRRNINEGIYAGAIFIALSGIFSAYLVAVGFNAINEMAT